MSRNKVVSPFMGFDFFFSSLDKKSSTQEPSSSACGPGSSNEGDMITDESLKSPELVCYVYSVSYCVFPTTCSANFNTETKQ